MIRRAHTATQRTARDAAIARRAGAAVAAYTQSHRHSAPTAHAWIETLHAGTNSCRTPRAQHHTVKARRSPICRAAADRQRVSTPARKTRP